MTVSRVINGESNVRDSTRETVMEAVRALNYRDVHRMLEVHLADDPAVAVRRSVVMSRRPSLEAEHGLAAQCKMSGSRATHGAEPGDDYVVANRHIL